MRLKFNHLLKRTHLPGKRILCQATGGDSRKSLAQQRGSPADNKQTWECYRSFHQIFPKMSNYSFHLLVIFYCWLCQLSHRLLPSFLWAGFLTLETPSSRIKRALITYLFISIKKVTLSKYTYILYTYSILNKQQPQSNNEHKYLSHSRRCCTLLWWDSCWDSPCSPQTWTAHTSPRQRCNASEGKNRDKAQSSSEPYSGLVGHEIRD